jgi:hypothetical protein
MDNATMRARFQKALDVGGNVYEIEDIVAGIKTGEFQAFSSEDAFVVTEIRVFPRKKVLSVVAAAGSLPAVMALQPQFTRFAIEQGCSSLFTSGRLGWQRVLPKYGWKHKMAAFALDLGAKHDEP